MEFMDELEKLGVDVKEGMDRVMGDESLYRMMLGMFADAVKTTPVSVEDFDAGDLTELTGRIHTLKGTAGNLSILPLFTRYTEMLGLLRGGQSGEAKEVFEKTLPVQNNIIACIERHQNEG